MCVSETIALFGGACAGKTAVAKELSNILGWEVRHCSAEVWLRAKARNESPWELPLAVHNSVDEETRRTVVERTPLVVEGRFLDCVLRVIPRVRLFLLTCEESVREARWIRRAVDGLGHLPESSLAMEDEQDELLRRRLYPAFPCAQEFSTADTTRRVPRSVAEEVLQSLKDSNR